MTSSRAWQLWRDDEEMAKKDDDLSLPGHPKHRTDWKPARVPRRSWVKRIMVYALIIAALFFLLGRRRRDSLSKAEPPSRPWDDHESVEKAYEERFNRGRGAPVTKDSVHKSPSENAVGKHQRPIGNAANGRLQPRPKYDGPIQFPALSSTLVAFSEKAGASYQNRNVVFAAASLESASKLLPMACEMAMERQNYVHFAFMGVADIGIKEMLEINGIDKDCRVMTHDARPDHYESSTEHRTQIAITTALYYINRHIHPRAVLLDSTTAEEDYFLATARDQILSTTAALIELPEHAGKSLSWISKLDASALSAWNNVRFDILIHATSTKTANLKRLLRSIAKADLAGIATPHITIEIPNTIEHSLESFLGYFKWPRPTPRGGQQPQMISLRRRITRQPLDEEDSSVRFVESFWPTDPSSTHVLVLSPHTEITAQFFQYVKYSLLHQMHSKMAMVEDYDTSLMGLSFSVPRTLIDGTTAFSPPAPEGGGKDTSGQTSFLWQRPNSEAMLFMGEKWIELHHFISQTLYQKKTTSSQPALLTQKTAGKNYPAWLEYALQLSRLRGYCTLYPSKSTANAILGVHHEVPDPPEEYQNDAARIFPLASLQDENSERFDPVSPVDVLQTLPEKGDLQSPVGVPLLSWDGTLTTRTNFGRQAQEYTALFRREVGGCTDDAMQSIRSWKPDATDLFCRKK